MTILLAHRKGKTEVNFSGRQQKIILRLFKMYKPQTKGNIHISVFPIQSECCHTRLSHDSSCEPVGRKMLRKCHCLIYLCTPAFWFQSSFSVPDCCCYHKSTLDHLKINIPHIRIMDFSVCLIQKGKKKKKKVFCCYCSASSHQVTGLVSLWRTWRHCPMIPARSPAGHQQNPMEDTASQAQAIPLRSKHGQDSLTEPPSLRSIA